MSYNRGFFGTAEEAALWIEVSIPAVFQFRPTTSRCLCLCMLRLQLWNDIKPSGNCGMFSSVLSCPKPSVALPKTPSLDDNEDRTAGPTLTSRPTVDADWHVHTYTRDLKPKSSHPYKVKWQVALEWIGFAVSRANFGICGWEKHQVFRKDILQCLFSLLPRMHPVVLTDWLLALRKSPRLCAHICFFSASVLVNDSAELTKWMFSEPAEAETAFHFENADWSKFVVCCTFCCSHFLWRFRRTYRIFLASADSDVIVYFVASSQHQL